jgi:hypothetical protein
MTTASTTENVSGTGIRLEVVTLSFVSSNTVPLKIPPDDQAVLVPDFNL